AQRALHLVQELGAGLELGRVLAVLDVHLQRVARLLQRFVELRLDPGKRGEVDVVLQPHSGVLSSAGRAHARPLRCRCGVGQSAGSLKSATERRRSAASCARFPIDSAVWLAPCEVCVVISWMTDMVAVMLVAATDCCRAAVEMFWMRSARSVETVSISPSARPASSASRAPATTSAVV